MTPVDDRDHTTNAPSLAESAVTLLAREAGRMPIVALSLGLQAWQRTRGVRELALRRGNEVLQIVAHTPLGRLLPQPELDDDAQAEAAEIAQTAARATAEATATARRTVSEAARETTATPGRSGGGGGGGGGGGRGGRGAAPAAAVAAGAPGVATGQADRVTERLGVETPTSREDLPIPDFDNISIGSLRARLRTLSLEQLAILREWEQAHANRLPVVTLLDNRIAKVAADAPGTSAYPADTPAATTGRGAAEGAKQAARDEGGTLRV